LIIPHCCGQSDATFLLGNGDGTFQSEQQFLSGISPTGVAVTNFGGNTGLVAVDQGGTMVALALVSPMKVAQADSLALDENKVAGSRGSERSRARQQAVFRYVIELLKWRT
jgi:hypothetical protein